MRYTIFIGLLIIFSNGAFAETRSLSGQVGLIRLATESHSTVDARSGSVFLIEGDSLVAPCTWLLIKPEDKNALSLLLTAKAMKANVKVFYNLGGSTSWGGASMCEVTNIDI